MFLGRSHDDIYCNIQLKNFIFLAYLFKVGLLLHNNSDINVIINSNIITTYLKNVG